MFARHQKAVESSTGRLSRPLVHGGSRLFLLSVGEVCERAKREKEKECSTVSSLVKKELSPQSSSQQSANQNQGAESEAKGRKSPHESEEARKETQLQHAHSSVNDLANPKKTFGKKENTCEARRHSEEKIGYYKHEKKLTKSDTCVSRNEKSELRVFSKRKEKPSRKSTRNSPENENCNESSKKLTKINENEIKGKRKEDHASSRNERHGGVVRSDKKKEIKDKEKQNADNKHSSNCEIIRQLKKMSLRSGKLDNNINTEQVKACVNTPKGFPEPSMEVSSSTPKTNKMKITRTHNRDSEASPNQEENSKNHKRRRSWLSVRIDKDHNKARCVGKMTDSEMVQMPNQEANSAIFWDDELNESTTSWGNDSTRSEGLSQLAEAYGESEDMSDREDVHVASSDSFRNSCARTDSENATNSRSRSTSSQEVCSQTSARVLNIYRNISSYQDQQSVVKDREDVRPGFQKRESAEHKSVSVTGFAKTSPTNENKGGKDGFENTLKKREVGIYRPPGAREQARILKEQNHQKAEEKPNVQIQSCKSQNENKQYKTIASAPENNTAALRKTLSSSSNVVPAVKPSAHVHPMLPIRPPGGSSGNNSSSTVQPLQGIGRGTLGRFPEMTGPGRVDLVLSPPSISEALSVPVTSTAQESIIPYVTVSQNLSPAMLQSPVSPSINVTVEINVNIDHRDRAQDVTHSTDSPHHGNVTQSVPAIPSARRRLIHRESTDNSNPVQHSSRHDNQQRRGWSDGFLSKRQDSVECKIPPEKNLESNIVAGKAAEPKVKQAAGAVYQIPVKREERQNHSSVSSRRSFETESKFSKPESQSVRRSSAENPSRIPPAVSLSAIQKDAAASHSVCIGGTVMNPVTSRPSADAEQKVKSKKVALSIPLPPEPALNEIPLPSGKPPNDPPHRPTAHKDKARDTKTSRSVQNDNTASSHLRTAPQQKANSTLSAIPHQYCPVSMDEYRNLVQRGTEMKPPIKTRGSSLFRKALHDLQAEANTNDNLNMRQNVLPHADRPIHGVLCDDESYSQSSFSDQEFPRTSSAIHSEASQSDTGSMLSQESIPAVPWSTQDGTEQSCANNSWEYSPVDTKWRQSRYQYPTQVVKSRWDDDDENNENDNNSGSNDVYGKDVSVKDQQRTTPIRRSLNNSYGNHGNNPMEVDWFGDTASEDSASWSDGYQSENFYRPPPPPPTPPALVAGQFPGSPYVPPSPFWTYTPPSYAASSASPVNMVTQNQTGSNSCPPALTNEGQRAPPGCYPAGYGLATDGGYGGSYDSGYQYKRDQYQSLQNRLTRIQNTAAEVTTALSTPVSTRSAGQYYSGLGKVDWVNWKQKFQQKYAKCAVPYIDSHCHLDFLFDRSGFKGSYSRFMNINEETFPSNYSGCLAVFCEPRSFTPEGGLWKDLLNEPTVWGALGCHPKCISDFTDEAFENLRECMKHPKVMALGEIGLDYSRDFYKQSAPQKRGFIRQLQLALELRKPLVIHCRDAENDCFDIMKQLVPQDYLIHRHCFTADWEEARRWLEYFPNLFIGLTPLVTFRSAKEVHEVARNIPLDRLLLETDAPYFIPMKVPREEMKLSHPGMAITVAEEVARLKMVDMETVLYHCRQNTRKMYKI